MPEKLEERGTTSYLSNFNLMMYKVWLEKIRKPVSFAFEIILPIALSAIILWIYTMLTLKYIPSKAYPTNVYRPQKIGNMAFTLRETLKIIAIAPNNSDTRAFVDWWCAKNPGFDAESLWPEQMDELSFMNVPPLCKYIRFMNSSEDMDKYLKQKNVGYDPSKPDIYMGIIFDKYP